MEDILIAVGLVILLYILPTIFILGYGIMKNLEDNSTIDDALVDAFDYNTIPSPIIILAPILNLVVSIWFLCKVIFIGIINLLKRIKIK